MKLYGWIASRVVGTVAYLGFQKGGAKCSLGTSAHTKGGQTKFSNFLLCPNIFFAKGGHALDRCFAADGLPSDEQAPSGPPISLQTGAFHGDGSSQDFL